MGRIERGSIRYGGRDLLTLSDAEMHQVRGGDISMVFQEPMTALNPVLTIGQQIIETILLHKRVSRKEARDRADRNVAPGSHRRGGAPDRRLSLTNCPAACGNAR